MSGGLTLHKASSYQKELILIGIGVNLMIMQLRKGGKDPIEKSEEVWECGECGTDVSEADKSCPKCGVELQEE
jgi:rubrerythrin